jgi:hypothetical protein
MVACGSTYHTTPGAWQTGIFLATANQVNGLDSTDNNFYLTGVQLEVGSVATPFEFRPYATELALCYRYCQVKASTSNNQTFGIAIGTSNTTSRVEIPFPVRMRATPTLTADTASNFSIFYFGTRYACSGTITLTIASQDYASLSITHTGTSYALPWPAHFVDWSASGAWLRFDAEL